MTTDPNTHYRYPERWAQDQRERQHVANVLARIEGDTLPHREIAGTVEAFGLRAYDLLITSWEKQRAERAHRTRKHGPQEKKFTRFCELAPAILERLGDIPDRQLARELQLLGFGLHHETVREYRARLHNA